MFWSKQNGPGQVCTSCDKLSKGQKAPFTGVLLSDHAAAKLFADLKFTEKECELKLSKELELATITYSAQIESFKLRLQVETERTEKLLSIKDERIKGNRIIFFIGILTPW